MEKQSYKITIDAPREKVWEILWNDKTYQEWTSAFSPGSRALTDWNEGSKVLFLGAENEGMVSRIARKKENEFMSFEHLGEVHGGIEDTESEKVQAWKGAMENYTLRSLGGKTELSVEIDITDEYKDYFRETWPKALNKLKSVVEQANQEATV